MSKNRSNHNKRVTDNEGYYNPDISGVKKTDDYMRRQEAEQAIDNEHLTKWQRVTAFFANGNFKFAIGIVLVLTGIYLLISFLSFFISAGMMDQDRVANYSIIENARAQSEISNYGASVGAWACDFFISNGVGVAAFIIVVWFITMGMRLIRKKKAHFFSYTFVCLFSIFTFSMLVGAAT